jgi:hypothetical protein
MLNISHLTKGAQIVKLFVIKLAKCKHSSIILTFTQNTKSLLPKLTNDMVQEISQGVTFRKIDQDTKNLKKKYLRNKIKEFLRHIGPLTKRNRMMLIQ